MKAIKNAKILTITKGIIEKGTILIEDGKIASVTSEAQTPQADKTIDAGGRYVLPGIIDPHIHIGWPDWPVDEEVRKTTGAAAFGGCTTAKHFLIEGGSIVEKLDEHISVLEKNAYMDVGFHGSIFSDDHIAEIPKLARRGITSFKFFIPYRGAEATGGLVGIDDGIVYFGFEEIAKLGKPAMAMVHCENIEIFFKYKKKLLKEGEAGRLHWTDTRPNFCEVEAMIRTLYFAKVTGCPLYIVHASVRETGEVVSKARAEGVDVVVETCPHYLNKTVEDSDHVLDKLNPPIRHKEDGVQLWKDLANGTIDCVGTDHAPCAKKHKTDFWNAVVGFAGIETLLPAMLSEGVNKDRISINRLVEVCSRNTAKVFGLLPRKGTLTPGADADLVIVDMNKTVKVTADKLHYICDITPFEGWTLKGWPTLTMVRGNVVMEDGELTEKPGYGKFLPSTIPENLR